MNKDRLLRLNQIIPDILPVSRSHFWQGVKDGRYPQPIKISERITVWRESEILEIFTDTDSRNWLKNKRKDSPALKNRAVKD